MYLRLDVQWQRSFNAKIDKKQCSKEIENKANSVSVAFKLHPESHKKRSHKIKSSRNEAKEINVRNIVSESAVRLRNFNELSRRISRQKTTD